MAFTVKYHPDVGDYRVVFKIEREIVYILGIRHRKYFYKDVTSRVE